MPKELPDVDLIQGALYEGDRASGHIEMRYTDPDKNEYSLRIPLAQALYLLSVLKATQLNLGIPFPDDPRG